MYKNNITINIYTEPIEKPVNKFYPFWVYSHTNPLERAKKELETTLKQMEKQRCQSFR